MKHQLIKLKSYVNFYFDAQWSSCSLPASGTKYDAIIFEIARSLYNWMACMRTSLHRGESLNNTIVILLLVSIKYYVSMYRIDHFSSAAALLYFKQFNVLFLSEIYNKNLVLHVDGLYKVCEHIYKLRFFMVNNPFVFTKLIQNDCFHNKSHFSTS